MKKQKVLKLEEEIKELEDQIKHQKITNLKNSSIRNLKMSAKCLQLLIAPCVLTAGLLAGGMKLSGKGLPFYQDTFKRKIFQQETIDSLGNCKIKEQYEFKDTTNVLYYYSRWNKVDSKNAERTVEIYNLENISKKTILELFKLDHSSLRDIFKPLCYTEQKINISEEELNKPALLQAIIYSVNGYKVIQETPEEDRDATNAFLAMLISLELMIGMIHIFGTSLIDSLKNLTKEYQPVDCKKIEKKLKMKKSDYNRLIK